MNRVEKKFNTVARSVELTAQEKEAMHASILAYIHTPRKAVPSPFMRFYTTARYFKVQYITLALLVVVIGSSISFAAQGALPGEALYQVKTSVNENLQALFSFTPQSKAQLQNQLVSTRLQEVEQLAVNGKLSNVTNADVETTLENHLSSIETNVQTLENQNQTNAAADAISNAEASLKAHSAILDELAVKNPNLKNIADNVSVEATALSLDRAALDAKVSSSTPSLQILQDKQKSAQDAIFTIESAVASDASISTTTASDATTTDATSTASSTVAVPKMMALMRPKVSANITISSSTATSSISNASTTPSNTSTINDKLVAAQTAFAQGISKMSSKSYGSAYVLFQKAERIADEAQVLVQTAQNLNVSVPVISSSDDSATSTATTTLSIDPSAATTTATSTATSTASSS